MCMYILYIQNMYIHIYIYICILMAEVFPIEKGTHNSHV